MEEEEGEGVQWRDEERERRFMRTYLANGRVEKRATIDIGEGERFEGDLLSYLQRQRAFLPSILPSFHPLIPFPSPLCDTEQRSFVGGVMNLSRMGDVSFVRPPFA